MAGANRKRKGYLDMDVLRGMSCLAVSYLILFPFVTFAQPSKKSNPAAFSHAKSDLASFQIKRGFRLELVAAEPVVAAPVAMAFDELGRLFVIEMRDYPDQRESNLGQVRLLEDTDNDGVFETSSIYADNLSWPSAVVCSGGGVFVAATPEIIYLKDTATNGMADVRRVVFTGFGGDPANLQIDGLLNNFNWGLDNRIHGAAAAIGGVITSLRATPTDPVELRRFDFSFDPTALTLAPQAGPAQSGLCFDSRGRRFLSDFIRPLKVAMCEPHYTERNPYFAKGPRTIEVANAAAPIYRYISSSPVGQVTNTPAPMLPVRSRGTMIYRGGLFPANYAENVFIADSAAGVIHRLLLRENGLSMSAERAPDELNTEFLLARGGVFQPMQLINGPEGAIYVADLHGGGEVGRIYRIVPESFKQGNAPQPGRAATREVVALLAHTNGWSRDTGSRLIYEWRDQAAVPLLTNMFNNSRLPIARLHALHALDGLKALSETIVLRGLRDADERVREHAVLVSERLIQTGVISDTVWNQLRTMGGDASARVQFQLACTLGEIRRSERNLVLAQILRRHLGNPWMQTAILSSLTEGAGSMFTALANDARLRNDSAGQAFLQQLLIMIGLRSREDEVSEVVDFIDRARFEPQQSFTYLYPLGEGLRRGGNSFPMVDRQNRLQRFYDQTAEASLNDSLADPLRIAAIRLRGVSPYVVSGTDDFFQLLFGTGQSEAVQAAVINTLARYNNPSIPVTLLAQWQFLTPALRKEAVSALLTRRDGVPVLVAALENGRVVRGDLSPTQIDFVRTYPDPQISQIALRLFGPLQRERPAVLERFKPALRLTGIAANGRRTFAAQCARCHRLGSEGQDIGPDLAEARIQGKPRLLASILQPSLEVRPDFQTQLVQTQGGENLVGIITDENQTTITLRRPEGLDLVWPRSNVEVISPQPWSLMPTGLENGLTLQSMADLLEYIATVPR